jgi:hypothetical protein
LLRPPPPSARRARQWNAGRDQVYRYPYLALAQMMCFAATGPAA